MKQLTQYIQEKLQLKKDSKVKAKRQLSPKDLPDNFWNNFTAKTIEDLNRFNYDIEGREEDQTPLYFIDKVKYKEQLFTYWFNAVEFGWEQGYDAFRQEIIKRKYATEDEIDAAAIEVYNTVDDKYKKNCEKYFQNYNFTIKE